MTSDEIAHVLGVSVRTVDGDWYVAKAFLRRELAS
jgi:DNA-directed RNA polymerase specialized sigma24 family protein